MLHCIEKIVMPCFQYDGEVAQSELNKFLIENGGSEAECLRNGTAIFTSIVKNEKRLAYLIPGSWIRVITPGHFSVCSDKAFHQRFEIVTVRPAMSDELKEANYNAAVKSGMGEESARELVERMDTDRSRIQ